MNDQSSAPRAGVFRDIHAIYDLTETVPGLPMPHVGSGRAVFFFVGIIHPADARQALYRAETILRSGLLAAFYPRRTKAGSTEHYILTAVLPSGLMVDLVALAQHIDAPDAPADALPVLAGTAAAA